MAKPVTFTTLTQEKYPQLLQALAEVKQEDLTTSEEQISRRSALITRFEAFCQHCHRLISLSDPIKRPSMVAQLATLQIDLITRGSSFWLDTFLSLPLIFDYGLKDLPEAKDSCFNTKQRDVLKAITHASLFDFNLETLI